MFEYLLALVEALLVTVGDVEGEGHDLRGVLHLLNNPIQLSPAGTLTHIHIQFNYFMYYYTSHIVHCCVCASMETGLTISGCSLSIVRGE